MSFCRTSAFMSFSRTYMDVGGGRSTQVPVVGLSIRQVGQMEQLGTLNSGAVSESAPLYACPQGRFILACDDR